MARLSASLALTVLGVMAATPAWAPAEATTSLGVGAIYQLRAPYRLLASVGPTFHDSSETTGFHAFLALGLDF